MPDVFISSTAEDLVPYRSAAERAILTVRLLPTMHDYWPAKDNPPLDECLARVSEAKVLIVIVAHRYGWVPPDQPGAAHKSITRLECEQALREGKDVLAFILEDDVDWPPDFDETHRLTAAIKSGDYTPELADEVNRCVTDLRDFKTWLQTRAVRATFRNPDDLANKVSNALRDWCDRHPEYGPPSPVPQPETDPSPYLEYLREDTAWIDIRGLQTAQGKAHRFPIDDLYIPLVNELATGGRAPALEETRASTKLSLDDALEQDRLVIIGDPGSGKSTFLRRIAHALTQNRLGLESKLAAELFADPEIPFPILVRISDLTTFIEAQQTRNSAGLPARPDAPSWLLHFLAARGEELLWGVTEASFRRRIKEGPCLLMLDGLDEASREETRKHVVKLIEQAANAWPACRFIVTSRPPAYAGDVTLAGFANATIGSLEETAIRRFLERWSNALHADSPRLAEQHRAELVEAIQSRPEIRRVARNPVMLTALAILHWNEKRMPEQRADLYESIIFWLLRSRPREKGRATPELCLRRFQELARAMQTHPEGRRVQVPRDWAARTLAPQFRDQPPERQAPLATTFLKNEELDSGIVVSRGHDVRFWHLTFQEYLAARALDGLSDDERNRLLFTEGNAWATEWREVVQLLAGILHRRSPDRVDALISAALDDLYSGNLTRQVLGWFGAEPGLAERARCVTLLAAILQDLEPLKYRPTDERCSSVLDSVLGVFDPEKSAGMGFRARLQAAEALGMAGDPRLRDPRTDRDYWITIPGGTFAMGETGQECTVNRFLLGRHPVTVQEYRRFIKDGGFQDKQWWKAGGFGDRRAPNNWDDQAQHPNRPVTGVSWYEAAAFCAWASGRLPTEQEWEFAASGSEVREYPWGIAEPDGNRANYRETGPLHPTPVGMYPLGATPEGLHDMAGNVWEWTSSDYDPNSTDEEKVVRGGSWGLSAGCLRAAFRGWYPPGVRDFYIGFRCAREVFP